MADVYSVKTRPPSRIQVSLERLENFTRVHDKVITFVIVVCLAFIVSMVLTAHLVSHPVLTFRNKWAMTTGQLETNFTNYNQRLSKRALAALESHCDGQTATFGPQVRVDGKPWNVAHVYICDLELHLTDPKAVVVGDTRVTCQDEHLGVYKVKKRRHPLTVAVNNGATYTITTAEDACVVWNAIELITGIW